MFFTPEISTEMFRYLPYYDHDIGQYHTITMLMVIIYTIFVKCLFSALGKLLGNSGKNVFFHLYGQFLFDDHNSSSAPGACCFSTYKQEINFKTFIFLPKSGWYGSAAWYGIPDSPLLCI